MCDLPNLDFVRSVAVISVVIDHTLLAFNIRKIGPYSTEYIGVLGVLVFFVLTALVLMWSLERKPHTLDFYIRRCFRIYPLAFAVLVIAVLFHTRTGGTVDHTFQYIPPSVKSFVRQASLLQPAEPYVMAVMWSLPYEVQMYILLPIVFFFVRRNFSIWPLLLVWGLVLLNERHEPSASHNFAVAIAYFLPGVMAYVGFGRWKTRLPGWLLPVFLGALWAVFLYHFNFHRAWVFCLIVGLCLPLFRQMTSKLVLVPSYQIAKYSYGIYLTHSFALLLGPCIFRGYSVTLSLVCELIALIVLPLIAYHLIEHPMIRLGSRLAARADSRYEQRELRQLAAK